jgi:hypothetical protein
MTMSKKRSARWKKHIQEAEERLAEAKSIGDEELTARVKRLLKNLKDPQWQRERQKHIRQAKEGIAEAKLLGDEERARLAKGELRYLENPIWYFSEEKWTQFVASGKDFDVLHEERRQKVKETGYCDCGCCENGEPPKLGSHQWN